MLQKNCKHTSARPSSLGPQLHRGLGWTSQLKDLLELSHGKVLKSWNLAQRGDTKKLFCHDRFCLPLVFWRWRHMMTCFFLCLGSRCPCPPTALARHLLDVSKNYLDLPSGTQGQTAQIWRSGGRPNASSSSSSSSSFYPVPVPVTLANDSFT